MSDEKNFYFSNNNKYIDVDDSSIILDDNDMELYNNDNIVSPDISDSPIIEVTDTNNAQELIEEKENQINVEDVEVKEPPKEEKKEEIVELLSDEDLKPKTNETLYKMIVETLDDDQKLINLETKKSNLKNNKLKKEDQPLKKSSSVEVDNLLNSLNNGVTSDRKSVV